ncbi:hypothetical protein EM6_1451 [Asticcacaulis excentricus]|uniref:Uncharacterized protein n=1 Tax=Asticcacaulis excentricus TaxID=78587 RepID=A0A3G9G756_9CAUL|nr:hypothetical protein EM6_1451 [Asticcacaulis excentricus]
MRDAGPEVFRLYDVVGLEPKDIPIFDGSRDRVSAAAMTTSEPVLNPQ